MKKGIGFLVTIVTHLYPINIFIFY